MKKSFTLRGRSIFREVIIKGVRIQERNIRGYILRCDNSNMNQNLYNQLNDASNIKIGITLNKKLGKAHERNRVKRRIRTICRTLLERMNNGFCIVIRPDKGFSDLSFIEEEEQIVRMLIRAGIM